MQRSTGLPRAWTTVSARSFSAGYFLQKDAACSMNLFLTEYNEDGASPAASRLQVKVAGGETVRLNSAGGDALEVKCGAGGATLEVRSAARPGQYATR